MRFEIVFELEDEVVVPDDVPRLYQHHRGKSGVVTSQFSQALNVRFEDGSYGNFSRRDNPLRPKCVLRLPKNIRIYYR